MAFAKEHCIDFSWSGLQTSLQKYTIKAALAITTDTQAFTPGESKMLIAQQKLDQRIFPVCAIHPEHTSEKDLHVLEQLFKDKSVYGIKIFPGYHPVYPSDKCYHPFYKLAGSYGIPVIIHTGDTFGSDHFVKYSHPLDIDEIAVTFRKTIFVLAHLGNPWVRDAAELVYKNENVYADLSAFCIGHPQKPPRYIAKDILFALDYTNAPEKLVYGSDWPLVDMGAYITIIKNAVPKKHHRAIFFENANRIFTLGL